MYVFFSYLHEEEDALVTEHDFPSTVLKVVASFLEVLTNLEATDFSETKMNVFA